MSLSSRDLYRFDDFELQISRRTLMRRGEKVALAPKTFEVLVCLVAHAGMVVLKDELLKEVWPDTFVEESNLTQHIFWIRKALDDKAAYVVTIPGRGYEFTSPVKVVTEAEAGAERVAESSPDIGIKFQHTTEQTHIIFEESSTILIPRPVRKFRSRRVGPILSLSVAGFKPRLLGRLALAASDRARGLSRTCAG
ncbi:MAG: transcriptional regulator [Acidobacteriota bacterium]|nr:transcriptional regulator [Acidobacteriota bacterium]